MNLQGLIGIILAAGASSRMGTDKALLELPGEGMNFVSAQITSLRPHVEMVLVVAGRNADAIKRHVYAQGADLVINPEPERGQFSSLQVGLHEVLNRGRDAAMITHVDRLPVSRRTVEALKAKLGEVYELSNAARKWLVVPEYQGRHGHPIVAGREMIEAWLRAPAESTARDVEHALPERIEYLPVDDANIVANINTPDEYDQLKVSSQ